MHKYLYCCVAAVILTFTFSCRKDVLQWQKVQQLNSNTTCRLNNVRFIGDNICIAAGGIIYSQAEILMSADGGYTWSAYSSPDAPKEMYGMGVSPNGNIYLSGVDGDILQSKDSGKTWQFHRINNWLEYFGGGFAAPNLGIFVSSVLQRQGTITRVDSSFKIIDEKTFLFGINNIYMVSPSTGYLIGYGAVMKTIDGGDNWAFQDVQGDNFTAMDIHGDEIWMCGSNGGIYHTFDGGGHWKNFRNGNDISLPRYYLRSIIFKDEQNGWAVGDQGQMIYSRDGGQHWSEYERFTSNSLRGIAACPNGDLLVVGDNGALFRMTTK
jgi:photosystem II stability/assembly factor-like uncharacterized protein